MILVHGASMIWGDQTRVLRTSVDVAWDFSSITITQGQVVTGVLAVVCVCANFVLLRKTSLGLRFRAMAANPTEAALRGLNVPCLRLSAFAIAGFLAAASGVITAFDKGFRPQVGGLPALTLGIVAFVVGGRYSFWGPIVGGVTVGLVRSCVEYMTSSQWLDAVSYFILILFLLLRPDGLLGRPERLESRV